MELQACPDGYQGYPAPILGTGLIGRIHLRVYGGSTEHGVYENKENPAVIITYGHSKDRRPDLRQVVVGIAVSGDGGITLISTTHNGNTSDSVLSESHSHPNGTCSC